MRGRLFRVGYWSQMKFTCLILCIEVWGNQSSGLYFMGSRLGSSCWANLGDVYQFLSIMHEGSLVSESSWGGSFMYVYGDCIHFTQNKKSFIVYGRDVKGDVFPFVEFLWERVVSWSKERDVFPLVGRPDHLLACLVSSYENMITWNELFPTLFWDIWSLGWWDDSHVWYQATKIGSLEMKCFPLDIYLLRFI